MSEPTKACAHPATTLMRTAALCGLLATLHCPRAAAQTDSHTPSLTEITVTATRRPESIDSVPLSVAAYDQSSLEHLDAGSFADLADKTPGVYFRPSFEDTTAVAVRGIYSATGTATTGVYLDDTPLQVRFLGAGEQATNFYPALFDLERVEVLRGPQGTLFGAGSEGGSIRFITTQPSLTQFSGHASGELGSIEGGAATYDLGAAAGGPLLPGTLAFRVSAYGQEEGGYIDRMPFPGAVVTRQNINSNDAAALNAALAWSPTEGLVITPAVHYERQHRDDTSQYWSSLSDPGDGQFRTGFSIQQPATDVFTLPSLKVQWDLGAATVYSDTSYLNRTRAATGDYTFILNEVLTGNYSLPGNLAAPQTASFSNPQKIFTQEVRVQSPAGQSRLIWTVGAFYQEARQDARESIYDPTLGSFTEALFGATVAQAFGTALLPGAVEYFGYDTSHDEQTALFGQADLEILRGLQLTLGLRVSRLRSSYTNVQGGPINGGASSGAGEQVETASTPKLGLSYAPAQGWLVYASASEGFRPGGGNPPVSPTRCADDLRSLGLTESPPGYRSDSVWSYEVGSKHSALDGRLALSASAYLIRWTDIQQSVYLPECGLQYAANLGLADSKGFDLDITAQPFVDLPGLSAGASVGYDDAQYTRTVYGTQTTGGAPSVIVTVGERLNTAPWQAFAHADYTFARRAGYQVSLHADYAYSSPYETGSPHDIGYDPLVDAVSQTRFASVRAALRHGAWTVAVFAKNIFDSHDDLWKRRTVPSTELLQRETFTPRAVGLTVNLKF